MLQKEAAAVDLIAALPRGTLNGLLRSIDGVLSNSKVVGVILKQRWGAL